MNLSYHTAWLVLIALIGGFIYLISPILLPFLLGMGLAYVLDPLADKLERQGSSRIMATGLISVLFFLAVALVLVIALPLLVEQAAVLAKDLPQYYASLRDLLEPYMQRFTSQLDLGNEETQRGILASVGESAKTLVTGLLKSGLAFVNFISLLVITPLVSFYLLRDWDAMVERLDDLLPRRYAPVIRKQCQAIDHTLSAFLRGQLNVMLVLSLIYAVTLTLAGLKYSLLIALLAGVLVIVPYVGTAVSGALAVGVAYFQFGDLSQVGIILSIFVAGQLLEGYVLTPKLVGESVGLNPIWIIFGMLAGGSIMGFVGILLAVPLTAIAGVLIRFAVEQYKQSDMYLEKDC